MSIHDVPVLTGQVSQTAYSGSATTAVVITAAASDLPALSTGDTVNVRVSSSIQTVPEGTTSSSTENRYRVEVNGKQVEVSSNLPLEEGSELTLQVSAKGSLLELSVRAAPQKQGSAGTDSEQIAKALDTVLSALNVTEDELKQLSSTLLLSRSASVPGRAESPKIDSPELKAALEVLEKLAEGKTVLNDKTLADPKSVLSVLIDSGRAHRQLGQEIEGVFEQISARHSSSKQLEVIHRLEQALKAVVTEANTEGKVHQGVRPDELHIPEATLRQTIELLKQIARPDQTDTTQETAGTSAKDSLRSFLQSHLQEVKQLEVQLKDALGAVYRESGVTLLIDTLARYESNSGEPQNEVSREFQKFVKSFRSEIERAVEKQLPKEELRELLARGLQSVQVKFADHVQSEHSPTSKVQEPFTPSPDLSRSQQVALKSIHSQIKTLLTSPELTDSDLLKLQDSLRSFAKQVEGVSTPARKSAFEITVKIADQIQQFRASSSPNESGYQILKQALQDLSLLSVKPDGGSSQSLTESLVDLQQLLKGTLQSKGFQGEMLQKLTESLKLFTQQMQGATAPEVLRSATEGLLQYLEGFQRGGSGQQLRETLTTYLKTFDTFISGSHESQVMPESSETLPHYARVTLRSISSQLQTLLTHFEQAQSGSGAAPSPEPIQETITQLLKTLSEARPHFQSKMHSTVDEALAKLQQQLAPANVSQQTTASLTQMLQNAQQIIQQQQPSAHTTADQKTALKEVQQAIRQTLNELLANETSPPPASSAPSVGGSSPPLTAPPAQIEQVLKERGVFELLKHLKSLLSQSGGGPALDPVTSQFIERALHDLEASALKAEAATRQAVRQTSRALKGLIQNTVQQSAEKQNLSTQLKALRTLENVIRGNEILNQMSPLLQAAGEPALLLFPMFIQGMLSSLEMSFSPHVENDEDKENGGKNRVTPFQRLNLTLTLPSLGTIGVQISHRLKEAHFRFAVENEKVKEFLQKRLDLLESAVLKKGYHQIHLTAEVKRASEELTSLASQGEDVVIA